MDKKYYWACDGSGLLTEPEMKRDMLKYGLSAEDYEQTEYEITRRQTELENIASWFQWRDPNGSYMEIVKEYRFIKPDEEMPLFFYDPIPVLAAIDQMIEIAKDWNKNDKDPEVLDRGIENILKRLETVRREFE